MMLNTRKAKRCTGRVRHSNLTVALVIALSISIALCGSAHRVEAQTLYGSLIGNVTDTTGASIPNASVDVRNVGTGIVTHGVTTDNGLYVFNDLQAGVYDVTVSAPGFATQTQANITIQANTARRQNLELKLGSVQQSVTVNSSAPPLQTDRTDVNTEITAVQLQGLPSSPTRNFQSLYRTVPGSTRPVTGHSIQSDPQGSLNYNINGTPETQNNTKIDGVSDLFPWLPEDAAYIPAQDAIQSVNIVTNTFDAEQGSAVSSQINVYLKSGTNQIHGAAWEYNTNSALMARNYFETTAVPKYNLNQFGVDFGGPIVKDKLFYFADWERTVQRNLLFGYQTVPTETMRAGDFSGTGTTLYNPATGNPDGTDRTAFANDQVPLLSSAAQKMLALVPQPNVSGATANNYFGSGDFANNRDTADLKINYDPSGKITTFASYSISPTSIYDPQALGAAGGATFDGGQPGNGNGLVQRVALGGTYSFSPTLLLDANVGFIRTNIKATNTDIGKNYGTDVLGIPGTNSGASPGDPLNGGYPNFQLVGFSSLGNTNSSNPFQFRNNLYSEDVNLSWDKGSHSIRFGGEILHFLMANFQANTSYGVRGGFSFSGGVTSLNGGPAPNMYNSLADFLLGLPQAMGEDHQFFDPSIVSENSFAVYAQDQWQVMHDLTITYGLRYELYPYPNHNYGIGLVVYDPATNLLQLGGIGDVPHTAGVDFGYGSLAPRFGFAYRMGNKTVIRGGFGINTDGSYLTGGVQSYPAVGSAQYQGSNSYTPAGSLSTGIPLSSAPDVTQGTMPLPVQYGSSASPSHYTRGYVENYNLIVERELGAGFVYQAAYIATHAVHQNLSININAADPGTGKAGQPLYAKFGNSSGIGLSLPFGSSDYNALQMQLKRNIGRETLAVNYTYSRALDYEDTAPNINRSLLFNYAPLIPRNYAVAGFDMTHNFEVLGTYPLPFGSGSRWLTSGIPAKLAGGWQLNAVLSRTSGVPFTVTSSSASLDAPGNSQVANQLEKHVKILGGHGIGHPYFDPNAFAPVTTVSFGTASRNSVRGPGYFDLDLSVYRTFRLMDRLQMQLRADSFGLTNTPQFANPAANVSNATFSNGVISSLNGYDTITSSTGQREIRLGLKLVF